MSNESAEKTKKRVLGHKTSSLSRGISQAIVIKNDEIAFLCGRDGRIPLDDRDHGLGLYYHDCRYLNGCDYSVGGALPTVLSSSGRRGHESVFVSANHEMVGRDGRPISKEAIAIRHQYVIESEHRCLKSIFRFESYTAEDLTFTCKLVFASQFEDIFIVRGMDRKHGQVQPVRWEGDVLFFEYKGGDGLWRSVSVHFSAPPVRRDGAVVYFEVPLRGRQKWELVVSIVIAESEERREVQPRPLPNFIDVDQLSEKRRTCWMAWRKEITSVGSDSKMFNAIFERALGDLHELIMHMDGNEFFAAGVPWYCTLFGRDSLIASLEMLPFAPQIAAQTLRLLARLQGTKYDEAHDEQPGKIMHEMRVGELARMNEVPFNPYYGSVDVTPLFLITVVQHAAWCGDLQLFRELRKNIDAALQWIDKDGDHDGDGYIDYQSTGGTGLTNKGWKDSGNCIVNRDGSLARQPIALAEVQGYVYAAWIGIADLLERNNERAAAESLRKKAEAFRERFLSDYWMADEGCFALALQAGKMPAEAVASNAGQVLWSGIADQEKAVSSAHRLLQDDMFSGWGIRTLTEKQVAFNPIGYHLGTVWPHDNALIAAGFKRYGLDQEAVRIFNAILDAASFFDEFRLPEVFSGFSRLAYEVPIHYPVACHPQAWAAGSVPMLLATVLGFVPDGFNQRLRIIRPHLPEAVDSLEFTNLRVGRGSVDLSFQRAGDTEVRIEVKRSHFVHVEQV